MHSIEQGGATAAVEGVCIYACVGGKGGAAAVRGGSSAHPKWSGGEGGITHTACPLPQLLDMFEGRRSCPITRIHSLTQSLTCSAALRAL